MEFVSETITPVGGRFDQAAMSRGEPGLPSAFTWRDEQFDVAERLDSWKHSERERGRGVGELYLRRHYHKLRMSDRSVWTVYFVRQTPKSGSATARWFLYGFEKAQP